GRLGDYAAARTELEGALQLFGGLADRPRIAQTLNRLGSVAYLSGQGKQARDYYCRALIELAILGAIQEKAEGLYNLSFVPPKSEEKGRLLDEGLLLAREAGDGLLEGRLLHVAGDTYVNRGDFAKALEKYEQAAHRYEQANARTDLARVFNSL